MTIGEGGKSARVTIAYTLLLEDGSVVEQAEEREPFSFDLGQREVLPGIERALLGRRAGDEIEVLIEPDEAFGPYDDEKVRCFPREAFDANIPLEPGHCYEAESSEGLPVAFLVREIRGSEGVVVDFNHPLAGQRLQLRLRILGVD